MKKKILKLLDDVGFLLRLYVIIYGFTMLATVLFMAFFGTTLISFRYMLNSMIFTGAALLPCFLEWNLEDKSVKEILIRRSIHLLLNELILMPLGYRFGMWGNLAGGILMFVVILAVSIGTGFVIFGRDAFLSHQINSKLKEFQQLEHTDTEM